MPVNTQRLVVNGSVDRRDKTQSELDGLNLQLKQNKAFARFHGDNLIGDKVRPSGFLAKWRNGADDFRRILLNPRNYPAIGRVVSKAVAGQGLDMKAGAGLVGALSNDSNRRAALVESQVRIKYDRMLHPPLTYLGDAFQYRTADGKFNSAMNPHLGQAGAPYAKTVPSKTHPLGALPDPGDLFDRLMAREEGGRNSPSGLSSMLIYHATLIIHDIFRTNDNDKNISDSSSYLDLSPLYGYTMEMQRKVRDDKFKLGLLKPDTFAEDRLLRQPPGVCIMLVMYNRYHNYAATQLRRINENGKFTVPAKYCGPKLVQVAEYIYSVKRAEKDKSFQEACTKYKQTWDEWMTDSSKSNLEKATQALQNIIDRANPSKTDRKKFEDAYDATPAKDPGLKILEMAKKFVPVKKDDEKENFKALCTKYEKALARWNTDGLKVETNHKEAAQALQSIIDRAGAEENEQKKFEDAYDAAWNKQDDDLFNTARLITCGMYVQVSVHDYLRALMGFHQFNTNFTLDPRIAMNDHKNVSRGLGNQVTVEFNLLYRFHCAISQKDEEYTESFMKEIEEAAGGPPLDPKTLSLQDFLKMMAASGEYNKNAKPTEPWDQEFGLKKTPDLAFTRNPITGLFDDKQMVNQLVKCMDDPISNFGPRNVPRSLRSVEIMGILQARKWEIGTLNDFREFFSMARHETFESITGDVDMQDALRDLYEHPDKVELYPGVFCESDKNKNLDPGPSDVDAALWAAIFSDAITLVRSDRFYTVDWNTNSLTSWGMKEVTADSDILKSSVFHRLLQRAFPGWFPYNSIRFFHPFYTSEQNAVFAQQQGYAPDFRMEIKPLTTNALGQPTKYGYDVEASNPKKPWKPVYLDDYEKIAAVLADESDDLIHPARSELNGLPPKVAEILASGPQTSSTQPKGSKVETDDKIMMKYFVDLMRDIVKREAITMDSKRAVYQIDITRDFAIPVTTRYVSDFLGFGHLIRSDKNPKAPYSENEIYQHITNCQIFFSYNADETKLLKRRQAYKSSMNVLYKITKDANVLEASRWTITQWTRNSFRYIFSLGKKADNPMTKLGFMVAKRILEHEKDSGRAAAILLLIALDSAYNSVLAFTSVLDSFMKGLYKLANPPDPTKSCDWLKVQKLVLEENGKGTETLRKMVLEAQHVSVRLPIIRRALKSREFKNEQGDILFSVNEGETIICDINRAKQRHPGAFSETDYLTYQPTFTSKFAEYHPEHVAILGLTAMIKVVAQMKNVRRGHDTQGRLKKVNLDSSCEGYSNFMAPMRMRMVERDADYAKNHSNQKEAEKVFTTKILKPSTDTYLTPEWDEFVPFPTTWKVRFDGFGESDYGKDFALLQQSIAGLPDDFPPFYQAQGASKFGGSFADTVCVCNPTAITRSSKNGGNAKADKTPAENVPVKSAGCGVPGEGLIRA